MCAEQTLAKMMMNGQVQLGKLLFTAILVASVLVCGTGIAISYHLHQSIIVITEQNKELLKAFIDAGITVSTEREIIIEQDSDSGSNNVGDVSNSNNNSVTITK